ncbi:B12-binding domain-containing radical SAM protein [Acidobacteriota bacterium]
MSFEKILLVMPSGRHGLGYGMDLIPTGLEYLAAYIENSVSDVHIIDLKMEKRSIDYFLHRFKPDLVGISMCATEHTEGLAIAHRAHELGMATVVGNFHPTGLAHFFASHPEIDFVVRGEGEVSLIELVKNGHAQGVLGVSYNSDTGVVHNPDRPLIEDLDILPFPARHLRKHKYNFPLDKKKEMEVLTFSRGCWGKCTFCCEPSMNRGIQRYRSSENIAKEIIEVYEWHGDVPLLFALTDPCALGNASIIEELCDLLIPLKLDLEIGCHVRADKVVAHPDVIGKMVKAGFVTFEMGIESPYHRDLSGTQKGFGPDVHEKACRILRKHGAQPLGTFVIGLPEQTEEEILSFPAYGRHIGLSRAAFGIATPFPGTEFHRALEKKGLIFEEDWTRFDEMHSVFHTKHLPAKRVEELFSRCLANFWTIDKLLDIENLEWKRTGRRKSLIEFGKYIWSLMEMGRNGLKQLHANDYLLHILEFLEEVRNDAPREKAQDFKIHEIFNMDRFLKIIGDQTIEITFFHQLQALTSWVFMLKNRKVDCIRVIKGEEDGATIHFRFDLEVVEEKKNPSFGRTTILLFKLLNSNKGFKRRINLFRLLLAIAFEKK